MLKKILFIVIALILGVVFAYSSYYSNYIDNLYNIVETAMEEERYEDVGRLFTSYFDSNSVVEKNETESGFIQVYPSIVRVTKTVSSGEEYTGFEKGYSVYGFNINHELFANVVVDDVTTNDSGIIFNSGDSSYTYPFVNEDEGYDLSNVIDSIKIFQADISESVINSKLNGTLTSIIIVGNEKQTVFSYDNLNLNFSEDFFTYADEFIVKYDECVEANDEETWKAFIEEWTVRYSANESYKEYFPQSVTSPSSIVWATVGAMAIYVVVVVLLGLLIFKGGKLFNRFKNNDTRYKQRKTMKGNTTKNIVKASETEKAIDAEIIEEAKEETSNVEETNEE